MPKRVIEIDPRSHLEVADYPKHRYAKNLRYYFREYVRIINVKKIGANHEFSDIDMTSTAFVNEFDEATLLGVGTEELQSESCSISDSESPWKHFSSFFMWLDNYESFDNFSGTPSKLPEVHHAFIMLY